jgi:endonuclease YncB( thermonuclease family)
MKDLLVALVLVTGISASALAGSVERAIDGDDLCLCGNDQFVHRFAGRSRQCDRDCVRVRLCGIDAPERGWPGYREATRALDDLTRGKATVCIAVGDGTPCDGRSRRFSHDRVVAQCSTAGRDLACDLVKNGHAVDWPRFSGGHYRQCT